MSELTPFDNQLAGLIVALAPASCRKLAAEIAKELRRSQQQRIKQQKAPEAHRIRLVSSSRSGQKKDEESGRCFRSCERVAT